MSLTSLSRRVARAAARTPAPEPPGVDWLAVAEACLAGGVAQRIEPDLPLCVEELRAALATGKAAERRKARLWLLAMLGRIRRRERAVTLAEWGRLAEWFEANDQRLYRLSLPSQILPLGGGSAEVAVACIRYWLALGARDINAGERAATMRLVMARYP